MAKQVGLPAQAFDQPDLRISATAVIQLLQASADASGREDFGLLMSDAFKFSKLGSVGLLMREQPTVGEALDVYGRFIKYSTNTLAVWIERLRDATVLHPILFGLAPESHPIAIDVMLGDTLKIVRALLTPDWRPALVCFARPAPANLEPYRERFGQVEFDHDFNGLVIPNTDLATPIPTADPDMAREIAQFIEAKGLGVGTSLADQVNLLIIQLMPSGDCTVEHVAERLGVDRRTIHRKLAAEGQSFTGMVEQRRRAVIGDQLRHGGRPLKAIASLLGFSSLSTFSRWYRHAYGGTARQSRGAMASNLGKRPSIKSSGN